MILKKIYAEFQGQKPPWSQDLGRGDVKVLRLYKGKSWTLRGGPDHMNSVAVKLPTPPGKQCFLGIFLEFGRGDFQSWRDNVKKKLAEKLGQKQHFSEEK